MTYSGYNDGFAEGSKKERAKIVKLVNEFIENLCFLLISDYSGSDPSEELLYQETKRYRLNFKRQYLSRLKKGIT